MNTNPTGNIPLIPILHLRPALSYDGDLAIHTTENRARVATFSNLNGAAKYGALFARAPQTKAQLRCIRAACLRLLQAAEGMNDLHDDESRAESYADELAELDKAKDQAREALNLGIPPDEQARRSAVPLDGEPTAQP